MIYALATGVSFWPAFGELVFQMITRLIVVVISESHFFYRKNWNQEEEG